jgi:hypothetical protein
MLMQKRFSVKIVRFEGAATSVRIWRGYWEDQWAMLWGVSMVPVVQSTVLERWVHDIATQSAFEVIEWMWPTLGS